MMYKQFFSGLLLLAMSFSALGQQRPVCGTPVYKSHQLEKNPAISEKRVKIEQLTQAWIQQQKGIAKRTSGAVTTIPVVVHVVYRNAQDSILPAQIQSQIDVLNNDFARLNADTSQTPNLFKPVAADTEIRFCLAQRNPDGDPATGITYTKTTATSFSTNDAIKFSSRGGADSWGATDYLNIWVGNLSGGLLGYATPPGFAPPLADGVVIDYRFFGTTGTSSAPYNLGRTGTHEVGHWLNLEHIWGDSNCGNDNVADTPTQREENFGCPSFPHPTCSNTSDMFMNYMDYTDDACMNLFTQGQASRMKSALNVSRSSILSSSGCIPVVLQPLDASILRINSPGGVSCDSVIRPNVVLKNSGTTTLDSVTIQFQVNSGPLQTYIWRGQLHSFAKITLTLPPQLVGVGMQSFTVFTQSPNGAVDNNTANDTLTRSFTRISAANALALPFTESFEGAIFPPANWSINNPDNYYTWEKTGLGAKSGNRSVRVNNYDYDASGERDELVLPAVNLTGVVKPELSFELAYARYSSAASDSLEVLISTDCGVTYTSIYKKGGSNLTTANPAITRVDYRPLASDWRKEVLSLDSLSQHPHVTFKFRNINNYENNLYIDDIVIDAAPTGIVKNLASRLINIYPNPTEGNIQVNTGLLTVTKIEVRTMVGGLVFAKEIKQQLDVHELNLSQQEAGMYLIRVFTPEGVVVKKLLLIK